jgi:hypothetical protein
VNGVLRYGHRLPSTPGAGGWETPLHFRLLPRSASVVNFIAPRSSHNELLSLLPPAGMERLRPHLVRVGLVNG